MKVFLKQDWKLLVCSRFQKKPYRQAMIFKLFFNMLSYLCPDSNLLPIDYISLFYCLEKRESVPYLERVQKATIEDIILIRLSVHNCRSHPRGKPTAFRLILAFQFKLCGRKCLILVFVFVSLLTVHPFSCFQIPALW